MLDILNLHEAYLPSYKLKYICKFVIIVLKAIVILLSFEEPATSSISFQMTASKNEVRETIAET